MIRCLHLFANSPCSIVAAVFVCVCLVGCGSGLELTNVKGKVLVNGEPYADANVVSYPSEGTVASGRTNAQGEFELTTLGSPGALHGTHTITVSPHATEPAPEPGKPIQLLKIPYDAKFRDRSRSTLTYEVGAGATQITIDLTAGTLSTE